MRDPRKDGFNYGPALGVPAAGTAARSVYETARAAWQKLSDEELRLARKAWALSEAMRAVRLAVTPQEQGEAVVGLNFAIIKAAPDA